MAFPELASFVEPAVAAATRSAQEHLNRLSQRAREQIESERDHVLSRIRLSLLHQGVPPKAIEAQVEDKHAHYRRLLAALSGVKVVLDSASGFAINR